MNSDMPTEGWVSYISLESGEHPVNSSCNSGNNSVSILDRVLKHCP